MDSIESAVRHRLRELAQRPGPTPWGPIPYEARYLEVLPDEIRNRDYGCGDPTRFLRAGEAVLDLGSGSGKGAYVAAQIVGPEGVVIGVDCHREMLALARSHLEAFAGRVGFANVDFRCGLIQDLRLDLDALGGLLAACPIRDQWGYLELLEIVERLRREDPLIADATIDAVICNGALSLVRPDDQPRLFAEMARVLRPGGRAIVCDLAVDSNLPSHYRDHPELWASGLGGALSVEALHRAFKTAGFRDFQLAERSAVPATTVGGIVYRPVTVLASKPEAPASSPGSRLD
jgi:SAM-dependent methyltransferase